MLFIQSICLSWDKAERGFAHGKQRKDFPAAYPLGQFPAVQPAEVLVHRLSFWQKGPLFQSLSRSNAYRFQVYPSARHLNLTNLSIHQVSAGYQVDFFYDQRRSGQPVRRGHNKDYLNTASPLYCHDVLNETAFCLQPGQYGRILWNERNTDYDTGEWYYQLHIDNLLHCLEPSPEPDCFLTRQPDFIYQQLAALY